MWSHPQVEEVSRRVRRPRHVISAGSPGPTVCALPSKLGWPAPSRPAPARPDPQDDEACARTQRPAPSSSEPCRASTASLRPIGRELAGQSPSAAAGKAPLP